MIRFFSNSRAIFKNKVTTIIAIAGFSASISIALVIIAFIIGEYRIDKTYPHLDRIYRIIESDTKTSFREDFRDYLLNSYPAIDDACRYNNYSSTLTYENHPYTGNMIVTDTSFFNIFSVRFLAGDPSSLSGPDDVVLTETFAKRIFGRTDPIGRTLVAEYEYPLIVKGIVKDFPKNSSIMGDYLTSSARKIICEGTSYGENKNVYYFRLFLLLKANTETVRLSEKINSDIAGITYDDPGRKAKKIEFIPFKESYFTTGLERSQTLHANIMLIRLLVIVTTAIILLAVFNYVNLSTASHTSRYKEIAIKKCTGAHNKQIFQQFMSESFILCFLSFFLALYLSTFLKPFIEKFIGSPIDTGILFLPVVLISIVGGILLLAILSGFYPAWSLSRLKPAFIISRRDALKKRPIGLRAALNIVQNAVSVALIISLFILSRQISFVSTTSLGFDTEKLLRVDIHWRIAGKAEALKNRLLASTSIKDICFTHGSPGSIYSTSSWDVNDFDGYMSELSTDTSFFNVFQVPLVIGRLPLPGDFNKVCYINETAFKTSGWETFEGHDYHGLEIIGVVSDFNFENLYSKINPLAIRLTSDMGISHMSLRISNNDIPATIKILKETWGEVFPDHELKYQFYDEWLDSMYKSEEKLSAAIGFFAVFAIIISCLGIFGMAEFTIRRRIKEIGIRKVNGSKTTEILLLLNKDIVKWSLIGFFISAVPIWFVMNKWLQTFAFHTDAEWWIFVIAGFLSAFISLVTVSWQSIRAATKNPVEALRYE
ncbi:MAG TPA: FtsX-like permease family protein [Bacteroidales bacterium]|nr:FtsX-like permease family protein [Bacteroidales bacterium]